jgi:hypothetical protein
MLTTSLLIGVTSLMTSSALAGTLPAGVLKSVIIKNTGNVDADDYHIKVKSPQNLRLDLKSATINFCPAPTISNNKTPMVTVDWDCFLPINNARNLRLNFRSRNNAVQVLESFFTVKVNGESEKLIDFPIPGFEVQGDPIYTIYNDFDTDMEIKNLAFLVNVPEIPGGSIIPGELPGFGTPVADFLLPANSSVVFNVPGIIDPGNWFYAQGDVFDPNTGEQLASFVDGHEEPIPESGLTVGLLTIGSLGLSQVVQRKLNKK